MDSLWVGSRFVLDRSIVSFRSAVHPAIFPYGARQPELAFALNTEAAISRSSCRVAKGLFGIISKKRLDDPSEVCHIGPVQQGDEAGGEPLPGRGETIGRRATIRDVAERSRRVEIAGIPGDAG